MRRHLVVAALLGSAFVAEAAYVTRAHHHHGLRHVVDPASPAHADIPPGAHTYASAAPRVYERGGTVELHFDSPPELVDGLRVSFLDSLGAARIDVIGHRADGALVPILRDRRIDSSHVLLEWSDTFQSVELVVHNDFRRRPVVASWTWWKS